MKVVVEAAMFCSGVESESDMDMFMGGTPHLISHTS